MHFSFATSPSDIHPKIFHISHHIWLRDHCRCPTCLHPKTMQRLLNTFQIPPDIKPIKVESSLQGLRVVWPAHEHTEHGEHESVYSWEWLKENSYDPRIEPEDKETKKILWNARISQSPPTVSYNDVAKPGEEGEQALYKWLTNIVSLHSLSFPQCSSCFYLPYSRIHSGFLL